MKKGQKYSKNLEIGAIFSAANETHITRIANNKKG